MVNFTLSNFVPMDRAIPTGQWTIWTQDGVGAAKERINLVLVGN